MKEAIDVRASSRSRVVSASELHRLKTIKGENL